MSPDFAGCQVPVSPRHRRVRRRGLRVAAGLELDAQFGQNSPRYKSVGENGDEFRVVANFLQSIDQVEGNFVTVRTGRLLRAYGASDQAGIAALFKLPHHPMSPRSRDASMAGWFTDHVPTSPAR